LILIGNDIVDLTDPQNMGKSRDTRFVNRVFGPAEQELISRAENQDAVLWALWAGKEAAYKLVKKRDPSATSVPRLYKVSLDCAEGSVGLSPGSDALTGCVDTPYGRIQIKVFITSDYVHCIGTTSAPDEMDALVWHVDRISADSQASPDYESIFVRKALKLRLSTYYDEALENIEIRRVKNSYGLGPPFVCINGEAAAIDISLSHDGLIAAYAFATTAGNNPVSESQRHQEWALQ
jgi:phosphopantetheinyl transferase (holo-ACP synthase)